MKITDDLIRVVQSTGLDDERPWLHIISAIETIANQLSAWGELLTRIDAPPDLTTVEEVAAGLSTVDRQLRTLLVWLDQRAKPHWSTFQEGLSRLLHSYRRSSTRESLSIYLRFRADKPVDRRATLEQELRYERERFRAGDGMIELSEALHRTLRAAKDAF